MFPPFFGFNMKSLFLFLLLAGVISAQGTRSAEQVLEPQIEIIRGADADLSLYSFLPKGLGKKVCVVILTGGDGAQKIGKVLPTHFEFARQMVGYGYAVFAIDYQNRNRRFLDAKWIDDIALAVQNIAQREQVDSNQIFIAGFSMGGTNAYRYLERNPNIKGLICYGSPMKFEKPELVDLIGKQTMPIHLVQKINVPLLFFQGKEDGITTSKQSREFVDSLKAHNRLVEYHEYENAKHGFTYTGTKGDRVEYQQEAAFDSYRRTYEFIQRHSSTH